MKPEHKKNCQYEMRKRKNYFRLFLNYCKKHQIWFSVFADGTIDECTDTIMGIDDGNGDFYCGFGVKLGTKAAYELLKQLHKELKSNAD